MPDAERMQPRLVLLADALDALEIVGLAAARIRVANLATGAVCTGLACSFVRGVECVPAGRAACKADANANVGNSNSGSVREGGCSPAHGSMPEGRRRLAAP